MDVQFILQKIKSLRDSILELKSILTNDYDKTKKNFWGSWSVDDNKRIKCNRCPQYFSKKGELMTHIKNIHCTPYK